MQPNLTYERKSSFPGIDPTKLEPVEFKKFKGDNWPDSMKNLSVNDYFTIGQEYPVYFYEGIFFVVGNNGGEYKITPSAWD